MSKKIPLFKASTLGISYLRHAALRIGPIKVLAINVKKLYDKNFLLRD